MQLLVLGANGLLGSNVLTAARDRGWTVTGTYHSEQPVFDTPLQQVDITDRDAVQSVIMDVNPDWVVNCAAMTDVDRCEEYPEKAHDVNARAPGDIAELCADERIRFLHVSTDYVFDGEEPSKYNENAPVNPVQVYGMSKLAGERTVARANTDALIARLSFVYGLHRSTGEITGFPAWVHSRLVVGEQTALFTDQHITPSRAGQAAETFCELIEGAETGTYHVASQSCVTPYELGGEIARRLNEDGSLFSRGSQEDVERAAERPSHTCLDVSRTEATLGRAQPTVQEDLDAIAGAFDTEAGR